MDSYYNYIKKRFKFWARFYDLMWVPIGYLCKKTIKFAGIYKNKKILDICTGTGDLAIEFAKQGNKIVGIDLSEDMITVAERKNRFKNLEFKTADATKLPFDNNSFEAVTSSLGLHEMPKSIMLKVLEEVKRVLKNNGEFIIVDFYKGRTLFFKLAYSFIKLFECKYYSDFINLDLDRVLDERGFKIEKEEVILRGIGRMVKLNNLKNR